MHTLLKLRLDYKGQAVQEVWFKHDEQLELQAKFNLTLIYFLIINNIYKFLILENYNYTYALIIWNIKKISCFALT
jgi:hypothetical protein